MRASAREQLEALDMFRRASTTLGAVLEGVDVPFHARPAPPEIDLQSAILNLCVLALRSSRAASVLIRTGYEAEAHGLMRRVAEAHARVGAVVSDKTGQHAREWLAGSAPSTPRKIARMYGNLEFFDMYSESTHASMTGLRTWVAIELPDGRQMMPIAPTRDPALANAMLVELSIELHDFAMIAGLAFARKALGLDSLDADLLDALERQVRLAGDDPQSG